VPPVVTLRSDGWTVKSLYYIVKRLRQSALFPCCAKCTRQGIPFTRFPYSIAPVADPTIPRRQNTLALFQHYAEQQLAAGAPPKGLEQAFAAELQISPSMWSQIKSARPIGDKLARQIEVLSRKPVGWLDEPRAAAGPSATEKAFLDLALAAWRATNSAGRRDLKQRMKLIVEAKDAADRL